MNSNFFVNSYSNGFNRNANLYNKPQWEQNQGSLSSFDQWIRQRPQNENPFVLYTGPQRLTGNGFETQRNFPKPQFGFD